MKALDESIDKSLAWDYINLRKYGCLCDAWLISKKKEEIKWVKKKKKIQRVRRIDDVVEATFHY